jgi:hypothetical protein
MNKPIESTNFDSPVQVAHIGNFHKTLRHDIYGEVLPDDYNDFERICITLEAHVQAAIDTPLEMDPFEDLLGGAPNDTSIKFNNPLAGVAKESLGPSPKDLNLIPHPDFNSKSATAEIVELYWMALLRDVPFAQFDSATGTAVREIESFFNTALSEHDGDGKLQLTLDLPSKIDSGTSKLDIRPNTLFRCGLKDEDYGPFVSQFFLRDIPYGTQTINTRQRPYIASRDFLTDHQSWLHAQTTGEDLFGRAYPNCNNHADEAKAGPYYAEQVRHIATMRDLARFVNRDALHQAYFNAALFLDAAGANTDDGNPYHTLKRSGGFATWGGPDLLTLVSEVASRSLKVVWRQKWLKFRRARPEVYCGALQSQENGVEGVKRPYGIPKDGAKSKAAKLLSNRYGGLYLPMAFSAGSPPHPAYGAGHATVAGACVTILKAWFDEEQSFGEMIAFANSSLKERGGFQCMLAPGLPTGVDSYNDPAAYVGDDAHLITVGGELNKLASNVAMGRSMGGVHWRSDNTRSLRLGEAIAIHFLAGRLKEYAETNGRFSFTSFNRHKVVVAKEGNVVNIKIGTDNSVTYSNPEHQIQSIHLQLKR